MAGGRDGSGTPLVVRRRLYTCSKPKPGLSEKVRRRTACVTFATIGGDLLHQGVDQSVPCEFGRLDRNAPTQARGRRRSHRAQTRQADLASDPSAGRFRQEFVQPLGDRRAGQRDPVDRAIQDSLDDRVGQRFRVGVVVDGDLVDIGQLFEFILEERSSSIGAGQQDFAAREPRGPGPPRGPPSDS